MRIVDPTHGCSPDDRAPSPAAPSPAASSHAVEDLCGLSNSKPGAAVLLETVGRRLHADHGLGPMTIAAKPSAASGAAPELLDHLAARYRLAVVAIGD